MKLEDAKRLIEVAVQYMTPIEDRCHVMHSVPLKQDRTYYRHRDLIPEVSEDGALLIQNGHGVKRDWGQPKIETNAWWLDRERGVAMVLCRWSSKHSPAWRSSAVWFFVHEDGWKQHSANYPLVKDSLAQVKVLSFLAQGNDGLPF